MFGYVGLSVMTSNYVNNDVNKLKHLSGCVAGQPRLVESGGALVKHASLSTFFCINGLHIAHSELFSNAHGKLSASV